MSPSYDYTASTTLGDLLRAWMKQTGRNAGEALKAIEKHGIRAGNFDAWLDGTITHELATIFLKPFTNLTGIDLDRLLLQEAKDRVLKAHPEYAPKLAPFVHREDAVDELKRIADLYDGSHRLMAVQRDVSSKSMGQWFRRRHLPGGETLDQALVAIGEGFLEDGITCREDAILGVFTRRAFDREPSKLVEGMDGFKDLIRLLYRPYKDGPGSAEAEKGTGLEKSMGGRLSHWKPRDNRLPPESVLQVLRSLIKRDQPAQLAKFEREKKIFLLELGTDADTDAEKPEPAKVSKPIPPPAPSPPPPAPPAPDVPMSPSLVSAALASFHASVHMLVTIGKADALADGDRLTVMKEVRTLLPGIKIDEALLARLKAATPITAERDGFLFDLLRGLVSRGKA